MTFFVLFDALVVVPRCYRDSYLATPVLAACTESRIWNPDVARARQLERVIASAQGSEQSALSTIPELLNEQIKYGLGGHYFYWRGLLRKRSGDSHHLGTLGFDIIDMIENGNFFEYMAQEVRRIDGMAARYCSQTPTRLERYAMQSVLGTLERFSHRDRGSQQMLNFDYQVRAVKVGSP
jgi:hypothetical protein